MNWYAGLGATTGTYNSNLGLGFVGQLGLEYNFNILLPEYYESKVERLKELEKLSEKGK